MVYELPNTPEGTAWMCRESLVALLQREVLGPLNGEREVLPSPPGDAYQVGRIAPRRLTDRGEPTSDADGGVGSIREAHSSTGVPAATAEDEFAEGDEDASEDVGPRRGLMIPASMGLRFQIPSDLDTVVVTARWGTYSTRTPAAEIDIDGAPKRAKTEYVRTPWEVTERLEIAELLSRTHHSVTMSGTITLEVDTQRAGDRLLVEFALCNNRETPSRIPTEAWMFQTRLDVHADGRCVFQPVHDVLTEPLDEGDPELQRLALQYRDRLEFAIGRTCSADWDTPDSTQRATTGVRTTWIPISETPRTEARPDDRVITDMLSLADADRDTLERGLTPIASGYEEWLTAQEASVASLPENLQEVADNALADARRVHGQLADGIRYLLDNDDALDCFRFMNQVMADQRIHSEIVRLRAENETLTVEAATAEVAARGARAHSWRLFQLAFVLMQLPALCEPHLNRRSGNLRAVELLFFPTGGGKTEAYLGLAAFAFAIRRRQGLVDTPDGPLDGGSGVTVLMRYTLRLLTAQQFQRATTMVCAAELQRATDSAKWGSESFRIGLWVGTKVSPKTYDDAAKQIQEANETDREYGLTVLQVRRCPWCGTPIKARDLRVDPTLRRVFVRCGDPLGVCPFAEGGAIDEGLPILTTDEEIYRLAPAFLIGTVDKFARLPREGGAASMFGAVWERCDRHGYVHPDYRACDLTSSGKHPRHGRHPAASRRPVTPLRPPDLIIQDELHLITGSLGTTVGLFEVAVDSMTTWTDSAGRPVKPLIVASSATVRNASAQVHDLYGRDITIFPPQVLDVADTYFSYEVPPSASTPGRRYVGLCASGVKLTAVEVRVTEVLLQAGQLLLDTAGEVADPYATVVAYFNATRELAGMARLLQDEIATGVRKGRPWSALPRRPYINHTELSARASGVDITDRLDRLTIPFPAKEGKTPYDMVLATSMLQVGVDVPRLGLMLIVGQPKNTAEYIQVSSRVGREADKPGLVVTLGNWARPRDLAHFEQFRHYHETFYSQVEALSVTPFSPTAAERGIDGMLVSAARVLQGSQGRSGLSPETGAGRIVDQTAFAQSLLQKLLKRAEDAADPEAYADFASRLTNRLDKWRQHRTQMEKQGLKLVYEKGRDGFAPLMVGAEEREAALGDKSAPFVAANSMREVQPEVNVLVSPTKLRVALDHEPEWVFPASDDEGES
jgi:hypothetical protein